MLAFEFNLASPLAKFGEESRGPKIYILYLFLFGYPFVISLLCYNIVHLNTFIGALIHSVN